MDTTITQKTTLSPKFFFLSLGVLVALITSVSSSLVLFFETLNKKFPDVLNSTYSYGYNSYNYEGIRMALATLIIFFPVFLVLSYFWRKFSKADLSAKDSFIFRWMIYLVIFISSIVVVIDLVTLVRYFVSGEITTRFIFKILGTAIVAFLVGVNYVYELKNHQSESPKRKLSLIFTIISILMFLGLIIWSFSVMGGPAKQRAWRLDERRVSDLQNIQYQVINYWQQKEILPASLQELANPITGYSLPVEPEFEKGKKYEYSVKDDLTFEICATFSATIPKGWQEYTNGGVMPMYETKDVSYPYYGGMNESWEHQAGRTCFSRTIDKDMYPPYKENK